MIRQGALAGEEGFSTSDLPGIGGVCRQDPADFQVEEIPLYEPDGKGEFLFVRLQKTGLAHGEMLRRMSAVLGIHPREIGFAGMKDKHAVTVQWLSLPGSVENRLALLEGEDMTLLQVARHSRRLATGHLQGNQFRVRISGLDPTAAALHTTRARAITDRLCTKGMVNFFGPQRFGGRFANIGLGLALLQGEPVNRKYRKGAMARLVLSAAQSWIFNLYARRRWADPGPDTLLDGEVLTFRRGRSLFRSDRPEHDRQRLQQGEVHLTGPMPGGKMLQPVGAARLYEDTFWRDTGLSEELFAGHGKKLRGERRALRVFPEEVECRFSGDSKSLGLSFRLPAGSYGTVFISEITKSGPPSRARIRPDAGAT